MSKVIDKTADTAIVGDVFANANTNDNATTDDGLVNDLIRASLTDVVLADRKSASAKAIAANDLAERAIELETGRVVAADLFMAFTGLETASTTKLSSDERAVYNSVAYVVKMANEKLVTLGIIEPKTKGERALVGDGEESEDAERHESKGWDADKLAKYVAQQCGNDAEKVKEVMGKALNLIHHS